MKTHKYPKLGRAGFQLGEDKPLKVNRKSNFKQLSTAVKHRCKELEMYRILNWELNTNYQ